MGTYKSGYQGNFNPALAATIAASATVSSAIDLGGFVLCGIQVPAAFTGVALTFQASMDGVTYQPMRNTYSGTALSYTVAQGEYIAVNPVDFYGVNFLKIVSGSTESALRNLVLAVRGF